MSDESDDNGETIEIEREELEEYVGYLRIARDLLQNGRARLSQGIKGIEDILDEDGEDEDDDNGGAQSPGIAARNRRQVTATVP